MLAYDIQNEGCERYLVCLHGYTDNKDSLKALVSDVSGYTKIFFQGPVKISNNKFSWLDKRWRLQKRAIKGFVETVRFLKLKGPNTDWLGFSQGGIFLFKSFPLILPKNLLIICSCPSVQIPSNFKGQSLFWYSNKNDPVFAFSKIFGSFAKALQNYTHAHLMPGSSYHTIGLMGQKLLKAWLERQISN